MEDKEIIELISGIFPDELELIEISLINYYYLKNKKKLTAEENEIKDTLYDGAIKLFNAIAVHLADEHKLNQRELSRQIKDIFIKT